MYGNLFTLLFIAETYTKCRIKEHDMRLMLWDTAGQEEFDAITKAYYRGRYVERVKGQKCRRSHSAPHMQVVSQACKTLNLKPL